MSLKRLTCTYDKAFQNPSDFETLKNFVEKLSFDQPSFVFHRIQETNKVDSKVRRSKTVLSSDAELLKFINEVLLPSLNEQSKEFNLMPARNHVTFIRYDPGDFFDWHQDFEKIKINGGEGYFREMHLIVGIQEPESGGQLQIWLGEGPPETEGGHSFWSNDVATPNHAIVFDKALPHRSLEVKQGVKIIMTVDVMAQHTLSLHGIIQEQTLMEIELFMKKKKDYILSDNKADFSRIVETLLDQMSNEQISECIPFMQVYLEDYDVAGVDVVGTRILRSYSNHPEYVPEDISLSDNLISKLEDMVYPEDTNRYQGVAIKITICGDELSSVKDINKFNSGEHVRTLPKELDMSKNRENSNKDTGSYTYHCNEPGYGEYNIYYRFGLIWDNEKLTEVPPGEEGSNSEESSEDSEASKESEKSEAKSGGSEDSEASKEAGDSESEEKMIYKFFP